MTRKMVLGFVGIAAVGMLTACGRIVAGNDVPETQTQNEQSEETLPGATEEMRTDGQMGPAAETDAQAGTDAEETSAAETEAEAVQSVTMEDIAALLGMEDDKTADLLGGGEENWTEDKSFFIGRIYRTFLDGKAVKVLTSVDENVVNAVSIWMADGEKKLEEEEVQNWVSYLTSWTGAEPEYDDTSSEAGSKIWRWKLDQTFVKMFRNGDVLTITLNPAVGEMK